MFQLCSWLRYLSYIFQVARLTLSAFSALLCLSSYATAADFLEQVNVSEKDGVYHIRISAQIAASEEHVRQVLTDYAHVYRLSDSVLESEVLQSPVNGHVQVRSLVLCCTSIFCRDVVRVDDISTLKSGNLQAVIVPDKSDFRSGKAVWEIVPDGQNTQLSYSATIEPDFFIPPLLGTRMVINNMREEFKTTFYRIEHIARINEARQLDNDFTLTNADRRSEGKPCNSELTTSLQ